MANKLNYNKIKRHGKAYGTGIIAGTTTTWTLKGKYLHKSVLELPINYLCWVSETFEQDNAHKIKADRELTRRYYRQINGVKERPVRDANK